MKSYFKFLSRNKLYTAIEVLGLAIALMFILIIAKFTNEKLNIDKFHEKADNIFTLAAEDFIGSPYGLSTYLYDQYPEIEHICAIHPSDKHRVEYQDENYDVETMAVDSTFLKIFSFKLTEGDRNTALINKDMVIISESLAKTIFRDKSAVGKTISIDWGDEKTRLTIGGVFKEIKNSTIMNCDLIFSMELVEKHINPSISNHDLGNAAGVTMFIQTYPNTDFGSKSEELLNYFKEFNPIYQYEARKQVHIIPLTEIYYSDIHQISVQINQGDKQFVYILAGVALFILLFALINYINLTVAQTGFRAKEMATRRLLGSSKFSVIMRFIGEAVLLTAVSFLIALLLAEVVKPYTLNLLGSEVDLFEDLTGGTIAFGIGLILIVGSIAGIIPALMISRYKPIDVVKGNFRLQTKMILGKAFVIIQNVITITMLALTLALFLQFRHLLNEPLGYKTENILDVYVPSIYANSHRGSRDMAPWNLLKDELEKIPSVKRVGLAQGNPLSSANNNTFPRNGEIISLMFLKFDTTAFDILGFEVIQQNSEALKNYYWLSESATKILNTDYDVTEFKLDPEQNRNIKVCGIVKDYQLRLGAISSGEMQHCNVIIMLNEAPWNLIVETTEESRETKAAINDCITRLTGEESDGDYLFETIYNHYSDQRSILNIVLIFTIITIIISTLGLIAMSTYYTRQRSLEVVVRKVFGSTSWEVFIRMVWNFLKLLLISFVIATPLAWYIIDYWLKDYSYRITISPLIFIAAGFVALLIAAIAISWQSAKAANTNPVETLKKE